MKRKDLPKTITSPITGPELWDKIIITHNRSKSRYSIYTVGKITPTGQLSCLLDYSDGSGFTYAAPKMQLLPDFRIIGAIDNQVKAHPYSRELEKSCKKRAGLAKDLPQAKEFFDMIDSGIDPMSNYQLRKLLDVVTDTISDILNDA